MRIRIDENTEFIPSHLFLGAVSGAISLGFGALSVYQLGQAAKGGSGGLCGNSSAKICQDLTLAEKTPAN